MCFQILCLLLEEYMANALSGYSLVTEQKRATSKKPEF